jgi:hypothetical protein
MQKYLNSSDVTWDYVLYCQCLPCQLAKSWSLISKLGPSKLAAAAACACIARGSRMSSYTPNVVSTGIGTCSPSACWLSS